jgi:hypothetical protein
MNASFRLRFVLAAAAAAVMFGAVAPAAHAQEIIAGGSGTLRLASTFDFDQPCQLARPFPALNRQGQFFTRHSVK